MAESKLILLVLAGKSALNGSFSLSSALVQQGHRVFYITSDIIDREYVESQGYPYLIMPDDGNVPSYHPRNIKNSISRRINFIRYQHAIENYRFKQAEKWINEENPDVVLLDAILTQYAVPFLKKNIPIITVTPTLSTVDPAGHPPVFSGLAPAKASEPVARLKVKMAWGKIYLQHYLEELKIKLAMFVVLGPNAKWMRAQIKKCGAKTKTTEYGVRLVGPEIIMGSRHIDFPYLDSQTKWYLGACVEEKRVQESFDFNFLNKEKKLIYCAMGTCSWAYKFQKNLYQCLFESMNQLDGYQLILQSDGVGDFSEYKQIPENVMIVSRAPQLELLKLTSLFITHGGAGSMREGAYYGVPMIVFPGWHDQQGNAARVVYHGLGAKGDMRTINTKKMLSLIAKVINDPAIRDSACKMKEKLRKDDNRPAVIKFIESYSSSWHA